MISVLLGLVAALCWSVHDLLARRFSAATGPFRMSMWIMLAGALLLVAPVLWRGQIWTADAYSISLALTMGVVYAFAIGGLLFAFSLAPDQLRLGAWFVWMSSLCCLMCVPLRP